MLTAEKEEILLEKEKIGIKDILRHLNAKEYSSKDLFFKFMAENNFEEKGKLYFNCKASFLK